MIYRKLKNLQDALSDTKKLIPPDHISAAYTGTLGSM